MDPQMSSTGWCSGAVALMGPCMDAGRLNQASSSAGHGVQAQGGCCVAPSNAPKDNMEIWNTPTTLSLISKGYVEVPPSAALVQFTFPICNKHAGVHLTLLTHLKRR